MRIRRSIAIGAIGALAVVAAFVYHRHHYSEAEVKVGAIFDLTGSLSYMGQWSLEGAKLAEDDINREGGIHGAQFRLVIDDAETNPDKALTAFRRMISVGKAQVVLGFNGSSEVMASADTANSQHVVLFSTGAASPNITQAGDFIFRNRLSGAVEASRMAEITYENLHLKKGAILYIDTDYGQGYAEAFRAKFTGLGGSVLTQIAFPQDGTDFRSVVQQVSALQGNEFIYLASHSREGGLLLRQAHEMGFTTRWLASNAIESDDLFSIARGAEEGVLYTVADYDPKAPYAIAFNNAYKRRYGRDSEMFAAHAYDGVRILAKIISENGNDGNAIRDALYRMEDYPGVSGRTSFDKNGDVIKDVALKIVSHHKFMRIDPENLQDALIEAR